MHLAKAHSTQERRFAYIDVFSAALDKEPTKEFDQSGFQQ
jgi:hypothetical protein